nr:septal ring lytic transglycosylase RlpA family protein [Lysobacter sp.]
EQGLASYYGSKFHGRRTSNLEVYDMNAFTAAHKTLPLPSFARVTNLDNGKSVVVRVNDRGPFHEGRIVDLSYAAAVKIGVHPHGTGRVELRALTPGAEAPALAVAAPAPERPSSLDTLLSTLPIADTAALKLPPGVRIATGKPTRLDVSSQQQPGAAAEQGTPPMTQPFLPPNAAPDWRFDMHQNGRTMTADEFDRWMKTRQVKVATGVPRTSPLAESSPPSPAVIATATPIAQPAVAVRASGDAVTLQVASFSGRGNADRALAMLHDAGIADAGLFSANPNGQQVWRLRVGPLQPENIAPLSARIAELGFGPPQRVRD